MDTTEQRWHRDFGNVHDAIPRAWLVHCDDGFVGIHPDYTEEPLVVQYRRLLLTGFARGWI